MHPDSTHLDSTHLDSTNNDVLMFFEALVDLRRLKIAGLLAVRPQGLADLAQALEMPPQATLHQLSMLIQLDLVEGIPGSNPQQYQLAARAWEALSRRVHERRPRPIFVPDASLGPADQKVLATFVAPDGRVKARPAQLKKYLVVLRYVAKAFVPGRRYTEKDVNETLQRFTEDIAGWRRGLVDCGFLAREQGEYWRVEATAGQQ